MPGINLSLPILHDAQKRVSAEARRFNVAAMGRRWGKTRFGIDRIVCGEKSIIGGYPAAWFAPSSRYIEEVWGELVWRLKPLIETTNKQSGRMTFIAGGSLDFWAMGEDPNVARGRKYARVIIDEAAHVRYLKDAWERAVLPTLTDYQGEAWFISTPNGMNFFHELWQRGQSDEYSEWMSWQLPTITNPFISADEVAAQRLDLPHLVSMQEYDAQFVMFGGGLVKPEMIIAGRAPSGLPVVLGVDLAISQRDGADYTAIIAVSKGSDGTLYIRDVDRGRWMFHETIDKILAMSKRYHVIRIDIEQIQYQAAVVQELLRTTGLPVFGVKPDKDKVTRFHPVLARYEQRLVRHDPALPAWLDDEILSFPEGQHDDCVDALSMAFAGLMSYNPVKYIPIASRPFFHQTTDESGRITKLSISRARGTW